MKPNRIPHKIIQDRRSGGDVFSRVRGGNGKFKRFTLIYDPNGIFTPHVAVFGALEIGCSLASGSFSDGTRFVTDTGLTATIIDGVLLDSKGKIVMTKAHV